jgi:hypothetical protein
MFHNLRGICRNQSGKLSLEAVAWMAIALLLVALGGAVSYSVLTNKSEVTKNALSKNTLICPNNSIALDIRAFMPNGYPIVDANGDGINDDATMRIIANSGGLQIIGSSPYVDINNGTPKTAEIVCQYSLGGY